MKEGSLLFCLLVMMCIARGESIIKNNLDSCDWHLFSYVNTDYVMRNNGLYFTDDKKMIRDFIKHLDLEEVAIQPDLVYNYNIEIYREDILMNSIRMNTQVGVLAYNHKYYKYDPN